MTIAFPDHIKAMLSIGQELVSNKSLMAEETGKTNEGGDKTLAMDEAIETALIAYLKKENLPVKVYSEEAGMVDIHPNPEYLVVFDPLDGSSNYRLGKGVLPFGLLIAIYPLKNPTFGQIVAAGAIEYVSSLSFVYDGKQTLQNDKLVSLNQAWPLAKNTPVYFDLYYKQAYETFSSLPEKVHIRWSGASVSGLVYVLNGSAAAMGAVSMRPEEIGTMVALIRGAGGLALNLKGEDLATKTFSPNKTYPILAGNKQAVKEILSLL